MTFPKLPAGNEARVCNKAAWLDAHRKIPRIYYPSIYQPTSGALRNVIGRFKMRLLLENILAKEGSCAGWGLLLVSSTYLASSLGLLTLGFSEKAVLSVKVDLPLNCYPQLPLSKQSWPINTWKGVYFLSGIL